MIDLCTQRAYRLQKRHGSYIRNAMDNSRALARATAREILMRVLALANGPWIPDVGFEAEFQQSREKICALLDELDVMPAVPPPLPKFSIEAGEVQRLVNYIVDRVMRRIIKYIDRKNLEPIAAKLRANLTVGLNRIEFTENLRAPQIDPALPEGVKQFSLSAESELLMKACETYLDADDEDLISS